MRQNGNLWHNTWNAENRLISTYSDTAGKKLEFAYDFMGRRVEKKVYTGSSTTSWTLSSHERFVYDIYKLIEKLDATSSNAVQQKFLWQPSAVGFDISLLITDTANSATYYYFADANKNIGKLADSSGNTVSKYEYSPFGKVNQFGTYTTNLLQFSSEYHDKESNLVYYNYIYYSPELGRWTKRDPIGEFIKHSKHSFLYI